MAYTFFILCIWANAFVGFSVATLLSETIVQTNPTAAANARPASGPSVAQAPFIRRLGRHQHTHKLVKSSSEAPYLSPSVQPDNKEKPVQSAAESSSPNEGSSAGPGSGEGVSSSERHVILIHHLHHHSFDKSMAGGGVILGGLATVFVVAVLCYIRATGRYSGSHKGDTAATASPC